MLHNYSNITAARCQKIGETSKRSKNILLTENTEY